MQFISQKINENLKLLLKQTIVDSQKFEDVEFVKTGYKTDNSFPKESWEKYNTDIHFKEADEHYYFHVKFHSWATTENQSVYFRVKTGVEDLRSHLNPQGLIYINGRITQAIDTNHTWVKLEPDSDIDLYCYYYTSMFKVDSYFVPDMILVDNRIEALYYDVVVPFEATEVLQENENKVTILKHLNAALNRVNFRDVYSENYYQGIESARQYLKEEFYDKECGKSELTVDCIGHTHIDIAWLWTYAQTMEKAQRSFSTVLTLMKQYPEYKFMSSQAVLYQFVKEQAPELYEQMKQRVAEGRWEVDGAMWLEPDCNLTSGESLVRHILYGMKFMKEEFDADCKTLWLPDTFGYAAALPQILKKFGIKNFVTSKIGWNDTNTFPHDTFMWEGIDGSEIFTNFMTAQDFVGYNLEERYVTYVGDITAPQLLGTWARYQEKEYNDRVMITYGHGDGGGGPTDKMLEYQRRLEKGIPGIPKSKLTTANEHLETVRENFEKNAAILGRTPKWVGELYLEFHRGTYTSIAKNKRNNRKAEFAIQKSELLANMAYALCGEKQPADLLEKTWKLILLNQFHDVLPGSSMKEVYEDSDRQYEEVFRNCRSICDEKLAKVAADIQTKGGILVLNPTSFAADNYINVDGKTEELPEKIPAFGWKVISNDFGKQRKVTVTDDSVIENDYYRVKVEGDGTISSLVDKRNNREIVLPGKRLNEFKVFEDLPFRYTNWELNEYYKEKSWELGKVTNVSTVYDGSRAGIRIERSYLNSTFVQTIWLYSMIERIDFETEMDWHEHHQVVKTYFPINIHTNKARYDIQFGNVERNTHQNTGWDAAKFEVCAHKWADISDGSYGVSLLNDCKYGHSCDGSTLSLTALKCSTDPNPEADQGRHYFVYSLLPHSGDFRTKTVEAAYALNQSFETMVLAENKEGTLKDEYSFVNISERNAVVEAVKPAEDGNGIIVRIYDCHDISNEITVNFGFEVKKAYLCDLAEKPEKELPIHHNSAMLQLSNYEIVTIKVEI